MLWTNLRWHLSLLGVAAFYDDDVLGPALELLRAQAARYPRQDEEAFLNP